MTIKALSLIALGAAAFIAGCERSDDAKDAGRPIVGLESADAVTFTSTADGGAMALLYDTAVLEITAASPKLPAGEKSQSRHFRMVLGKTPQTLRFEVRGFRAVKAPDAVGLSLKVGDQTFNLAPTPAAENFTACVDVTATKPTLDVTWTGTVKQVPGEDTRLDIDSIDIAALKATPEKSAGACGP